MSPEQRVSLWHPSIDADLSARMDDQTLDMKQLEILYSQSDDLSEAEGKVHDLDIQWKLLDRAMALAVNASSTIFSFWTWRNTRANHINLCDTENDPKIISKRKLGQGSRCWYPQSAKSLLEESMEHLAFMSRIIRSGLKRSSTVTALVQDIRYFSSGSLALSPDGQSRNMTWVRRQQPELDTGTVFRHQVAAHSHSRTSSMLRFHPSLIWFLCFSTCAACQPAMMEGSSPRCYISKPKGTGWRFGRPAHWTRFP